MLSPEENHPPPYTSMVEKSAHPEVQPFSKDHEVSLPDIEDEPSPYQCNCSVGKQSEFDCCDTMYEWIEALGDFSVKTEEQKKEFFEEVKAYDEIYKSLKKISIFDMKGTDMAIQQVQVKKDVNRTPSVKTRPE